MGQNLSSAWTTRKYRLLLLGLDGSGKTQILYRLKTNTVVQTIPTIGFNVEDLNFNGVILTAWDTGVRDKTWSLLYHYYPGTDALVFVVDSRDSERLEQAKDLLQWTLHHDSFPLGVPILLWCNKQDQSKTVWHSPQEIACELGLPYSNLTYQTVGCSAMTGEGLREGMEWLSTTLQKRTPQNQLRRKIDKEEEVALRTQLARQTIVLDSDPTLAGGNMTLRHFSPIQLGTECPFAKSAVLWGGTVFDETSEPSLEEQAKANVRPLTVFVERISCGEKLDGYCIELNTEEARKGDVRTFGECVRVFLTVLSDLDPAKEFLMRKNYIGRRGWRFRFAKEDFFVSSFAPCYPVTSSRCAFGCGRAFVLLQPETSFLRHNLPPDTNETNLDHPQTIRDKTRKNYIRAGRGYHTSPTDPTAHHVVKPVIDDGQGFVEWWKPLTLMDSSSQSEEKETIQGKLTHTNLEDKKLTGALS